MGVKVRECGFNSYRSAQLAGGNALEDFLNGLSLDAASKTSPGSDAGTELARPRHRALRKWGIGMTFIVHASRGEDVTTTVRLSVVVAIAKGLALAEEGWQVAVIGPDGIRYQPSEFDKLLALSPALHPRWVIRSIISVFRHGC
jgi:hypothetical protein